MSRIPKNYLEIIHKHNVHSLHMFITRFIFAGSSVQTNIIDSLISQTQFKKKIKYRLAGNNNDKTHSRKHKNDLLKYNFNMIYIHIHNVCTFHYENSLILIFFVCRY